MKQFHNLSYDGKDIVVQEKIFKNFFKSKIMQISRIFKLQKREKKLLFVKVSKS